MADDSSTEGCSKRARDEGDERAAVASSSSSSSSSSSRAARASRRATGAPAQPAPPRARRRTAAERARLAGLFLDVIGVVVAHNRGQFAHECWQCQYLYRETRYIADVTQPGSIVDMVFHGCRLGGVSKLLEEARKCKRAVCRGDKGTTQLMRAALGNDVERVRELLRLGCPNIDARDYGGRRTSLYFASVYGYKAVVRVLLAHGAEVNFKSMLEMTPLHGSSAFGHLAVVRLLSDAPGIDLGARDDFEHMTALGWALHRNHADVAVFLRSRGAPE